MKSSESDVFHDMLRRYRDDHGITQEQLADLLGTSRVTINRWETPFDSRPPLSKIPNIANKLGITVQELVTGERPEQVDACNSTGLSSSTIDALKERDEYLDFFIKETIERMLQPEFYAEYVFDLISWIRVSRDSEEEYSEDYSGDNSRLIQAGLRQSLIERYARLIDQIHDDAIRHGTLTPDVASSAMKDFYVIVKNLETKAVKNNAKEKRQKR